MTTSHEKPFRIIIVGCSVAGLTLANALQLSHRNVDCTVLESRGDSSSAYTGASLTLLPNGIRILNQLGVLEEVAEASASVTRHTTWLDGGHLLKIVYPRELRSARHGYDMRVIERGQLIRILRKRLETKDGEVRVIPNKRVVRFQETTSGILAQCSDGTSFEGDMVVGADGIHSICRRAIGEVVQCTPRPRNHYTGIFGTSRPLPGMPFLSYGDVHRVYGTGFSFIVSVGVDRQIYWLLSIKNKEGPHSRYTRTAEYAEKEHSIESQITPFLKRKITPNLRFADLYAERITCRQVALEEMLYEHWTARRIVCIGDSVHKMTPNLAQGANSAIESAASLANHIVDSLDANRDPLCDLSAWAANRKRRIRFFYVYAWILVRCESFVSTGYWLLGMHIALYHAELVISHIADIGDRSVRVTFLPDGVSGGIQDYQHLDAGERRRRVQTAGRDGLWVSVILAFLHELLVRVAFAVLDGVVALWDVCCWHRHGVAETHIS
ncbi:hypothetical protein BDW74DRAFT_182200 [Aspergillus multicolor]|uniref:FAD-dependent oxidoreductase n=1 Tax=Aspergillus multicolor TaxID=41759 RepID=UPI003CCDC526